MEAQPPQGLLDEDLRKILEDLSEGLFGLSPWIRDKEQGGKYRPPHAELPWRDDGKTLETKDLGVIAFLDELQASSAREEALAARWSELIERPMSFSPLITGAAAWRAERGLLDPQFGIVTSQNVIVDAAGRPTSREASYGTYAPLLRAAVAAANPQTPDDWQGLAGELFTDTSPHWPAGQPASSVFMKQFGRDVLNAMLGMRNPAPDPWRFALLTELGEHRRVGNAFTNHDVAKLVDAFRRRVKEVSKAPPG